MYVTILTLCMLGFIPVYAKNSCPEGWAPFNGKCYFISTTKAKWQDALTSCYSKGGRLASIKSLDERNFLAAFSRGTYVWLDGNDIKTEGKWVWSYNNEPINTTYWGPTEPNGKRGENCLLLINFILLDANCDSTSYFYACEKEEPNQLAKQCLSAKDLLNELLKCEKRCN